MLRHLKDKDLLAVCAGFRPGLDQASDPVAATKIALRSLARRHRDLGQEIDELDELIAPLAREIYHVLTTTNTTATAPRHLTTTA
ncbi:hypothetical protein E0L36_17765 [Streptomyces sp. AJS327]|uniref:hypothetical protein n=1 Tax=Streptomyces sp. AJS327 TaxID=2545265 RepID=UPI0015DDF709|nr:hypothetical protein [Streptomyces sp. AJS327]MBA0052663.1 hypothetical protein [Streptomyces sp. AJS327]